jgi:hypothetical protein
LYEGRREAQELLPRWGKARATLISNEKRSSELLLEETHACANSCLSDMQPIGRFYEASCGDDLNKSPGELDVHAS